MSKDRIVRCNRCGLMYVNPRFKSDIIINAYAEANDDVYISQEEKRMLTFRRSMDFIEKHTGLKTGRILDVGCAAGFFLKVAKDRSWQVEGVEPNKRLVEYGNKKFNLKMKATTLRGAKFPSNIFDIVTMWDVLEHTTDPNGELREAHRVLKKGGFLVVNIPDSGSFFARVFGKRWWFVLSVHLYYFTSKTLQAMLEKNKFKVKLKKRYLQTLELGYLVKMLKHLAKNPLTDIASDVMYAITKSMGVDKLPITYYAGQTLFLAKKE